MNIGRIPRKPNGGSGKAQFDRWVHEKLTNEANLGAVSGHRVINTTRGKIIVPSGGRGRGAQASMFKLKQIDTAPTPDTPSVYGDYVVCHDWDGTTEGTEDIYIAKPPDLRESLTSEILYGLTHGYSYAAGEDVNNRKRIHTVSPDIQRERVVPPWIGGQIIYAIECDTGVTTEAVHGEVAVDWLMISPSRTWAWLEDA
jgi:hypothetical protein